ncbi:unnamed protein product [Camellia sinensis]
MKNISVLVVLALLILIPKHSCHAHRRPSDDNHVALFIFGDSIFDVGNNNNINTTTTTFFQANFWPYGETTFNYPTGRCCDGRLIPDFIAEYAKLPLIPPYMQLSNNHQFTNGVNFASGGAGALVETFKGLVIDLKTQVANFKKVEKSLMKQLGDKEAKKILSRAIYLISIGKEYAEMVIGNLTQVVQEIYETGGRKFGFVDVGPLGCVPFARVMLNQENSHECLEDHIPKAKSSRNQKRVFRNDEPGKTEGVENTKLLQVIFSRKYNSVIPFFPFSSQCRPAAMRSGHPPISPVEPSFVEKKAVLQVRV